MIQTETSSKKKINLEDSINLNGLEKIAEQSSCIQDQFYLNKNNFNLLSNYVQELYTTSLDPNSITEEMKIHAERIERVKDI